MANLQGKAALITGAGAGLGAGISEAYVKAGAKICMVDLSKDVEVTAETLRKQCPDAEIITYVGSVADKEQMRAAAKATAAAFGSLDVCCANAGVCRLAPFEEMSDEMRDFHIDVNIKGTWNTVQACIPYMLEEGKGAVVIASSVTGDIVADGGEAAYAMS